MSCGSVTGGMPGSTSTALDGGGVDDGRAELVGLAGVADPDDVCMDVDPVIDRWSIDSAADGTPALLADSDAAEPLEQAAATVSTTMNGQISRTRIIRRSFDPEGNDSGKTGPNGGGDEANHDP